MKAEQPGSDAKGAIIVSAWPRLLSVELAATYLGLAPQTLRNHARELPGRKRFGRKVLYDRLELDRLIEKNNGVTDLWLDARRMLM